MERLFQGSIKVASTAKAFTTTALLLGVGCAFFAEREGYLALRSPQTEHDQWQWPFITGKKDVQAYEERKELERLAQLPLADSFMVGALVRSIRSNMDDTYCPAPGDISSIYQMTLTDTNETQIPGVPAEAIEQKNLGRALCLDLDTVEETVVGRGSVLKVEAVYPVNEGEMPISLYDSFIGATAEQCKGFEVAMSNLTDKMISSIDSRHKKEVRYEFEVRIDIDRRTFCDRDVSFNSPR